MELNLKKCVAEGTWGSLGELRGPTGMAGRSLVPAVTCFFTSLGVPAGPQEQKWGGPEEQRMLRWSLLRQEQLVWLISPIVPRAELGCDIFPGGSQNCWKLLCLLQGVVHLQDTGMTK